MLGFDSINIKSSKLFRAARSAPLGAKERIMKNLHVLITREFSPEWIEKLSRQVPEEVRITQRTADKSQEISASLWETADVLYSGAGYPDPAMAPRLNWIQLDTAGVNHILDTPLWRSKIRLTTLNGVAPPNMGEFAMMVMLMFGHHLPHLFRGQLKKEWPTFQQRWDWYTPHEIRGSTVCVIGYGNIGREIGRLAHSFGMQVLAVDQVQGNESASLTYQIPELVGLSGTEPDQFFLPGDLHQALAQADFVVLVVPYTSATHHMIDARALQVMRPSAVLINIARGGVVDEDALIQALEEKRIAGAALDVFAEEPLPPESPLWTMENVVISPHVAGFTSHYYERILDLFSQNINRYVAGQPLLNEVQRQRQF
jgi:phosphoglycerate dehydrogenase-like enzyme